MASMRALKLCFLIPLLPLSLLCNAKVADINYKPKADSNVLYRPGIDKVINLDALTFEDTVFNSQQPVLVEVYKDWCGYCRRFLPTYRNFAKHIQNWSEFVKVAALNCADMNNRQICKKLRTFGKKTVPSMKFFPAGSTSYNDLLEFDPDERLMSRMKEMMVQWLMERTNLMKRVPKIADIVELEGDAASGLKKAWKRVDKSKRFMFIVFEDMSSSGAKPIAGPITKLDLYPYRDQIEVITANSDSELAASLERTDNSSKNLPVFALYKRDDPKPLAVSSLDYWKIIAAIKMTGEEPTGSHDQNDGIIPLKAKLDCQADPESCKKLYFVSESDMLRAIKISIYNEVLNSDETQGEDFNNLNGFIGLLIKHFPTSTRVRKTGRKHATMQLSHSSSAKKVLIKLKSFLESKVAEQKFSSAEWKAIFLKAEEDNQAPFAGEAEWEHCKGSSVEYRGYTCGLWSVFHSLAVNSYLNQKDTKSREWEPTETTKTIRNWVKSFFGCYECSKHFLNLTHHQFPIDDNIKSSKDGALYLWRAHNYVNFRLKGDPTEDPQFKKYQFPSSFLCPYCRMSASDGSDAKSVDPTPGSDEKFNEHRTLSFLLDYYTHIKPYEAVNL